MGMRHELCSVHLLLVVLHVGPVTVWPWMWSEMAWFGVVVEEWRLPQALSGGDAVRRVHHEL